MKSIKQMKSWVLKQVLHSEGDIDEIFEMFLEKFAGEDSEVLAMVWAESMEEIPELN